MPETLDGWKRAYERALEQAQEHIERIAVLEQQLATVTAQRDGLRRAINDYRAGIMALNPALSAALVAHLPAPQGGDSEY